jgi:hypothetical protein
MYCGGTGTGEGASGGGGVGGEGGVASSVHEVAGGCVGAAQRWEQCCGKMRRGPALSEQPARACRTCSSLRNWER